MTTIEQELLHSLHVVVPPIDEQMRIVQFLERETGKIDGLAMRIKDSINRLAEYRTALITAAVMGKLDMEVAR